jgi:hypothetical protein
LEVFTYNVPFIPRYHTRTGNFYEWFSGRIRRLHASDYAIVSRHYAALLSSSPEEHLKALEQRTKAFEAGLGSPYEVLNPFLTTEDAAEISAHLRDMDEWADRAIEKVSEYLRV